MAIRRNKGRYTKEQMDASAAEFQRKIEERRKEKAEKAEQATDAQIQEAIAWCRKNF